MIDSSLIFSGSVATSPPTGQAIVATAVSTNVLDMLANRDVGADGMLDVHVQLLQAFNNLTSLQITYQTSADNSTFVDVMLSPVILLANLTLGAPIFRYGVPRFQLNDLLTPNRYHRLNYTVVGTAPTAGTVFSYITGANDRESYISYPNNYTVGA